jgi:hypothetical protein
VFSKLPRVDKEPVAEELELKIVIASEAKQSHRFLKDCFVASAPRNDKLVSSSFIDSMVGFPNVNLYGKC